MKAMKPIAALLALLAVAGSGAAQAQQATLGADGELYIARTGAYRDLFAKGSPGYRPDIDGAAPVLALDVITPGAAARRVLVPGTEGSEIEGIPSLFYEDSSQTLFMVWESRLNRIFPVLMLGGFDGRGWIEPIQINGNPMSVKTSPQLAVTHDSYQTGQPGNTGDNESEAPQQRSVIHLLWGEENGAGSYETFYTPIILQNGTFIGKNPVYRLNDFDAAKVSALPTLDPDLLHALRIQPGRDGQTVVAAFTAPVTQRVVSLEIDVLPAQLSLLADDARAHIIDIGRRLSYPAKLQQIADVARAHIIDIGRAFQPEIAASLADKVRELILANGGTANLTSIADLARAHIIDIGAKLSGRGLRSLNAESTTLATAEISADPAALPAGPSVVPSLTNLIQFRLASNRPVPQVGQGAVSFLLSRSGEEVLVAWAQADRVQYITSNGADWNVMREIPLSTTISLERAFEILAQRLSSR
jgi:hypothetical protein